jgi:hypothetical protein
MSGMGDDRSLAVGEQSVAVLHPHWKTLVGPVLRKSPLDRLLGCGTLVVESAGEHAEIILRQVPHVERVSAALFQLVEDERLRAATIPQDDRRSDPR